MSKAFIPLVYNLRTDVIRLSFYVAANTALTFACMCIFFCIFFNISFRCVLPVLPILNCLYLDRTCICLHLDRTCICLHLYRTSICLHLVRTCIWTGLPFAFIWSGLAFACNWSGLAFACIWSGLAFACTWTGLAGILTSQLSTSLLLTLFIQFFCLGIINYIELSENGYQRG